MEILLIMGLVAGLAAISKAPTPVEEMESPPVEIVPDDIPPNIAPVIIAAQTAVALGVTGIALSVADRLVANFNAQQARIAAEGQWVDQIKTFLNGIPPEIYKEASVRDIAVAIVTHLGFGGSWRIGFPDPVIGMMFVLSFQNQDTHNLRTIHVWYQRALMHSVNRLDEYPGAATAVRADVRRGSPILFLGIEPWHTEMRETFF